MSTNHITSRAFPGIVLCSNGKLLWGDLTIHPVDGSYHTPDGVVSALNLKLLLSFNIVLPTIHWCEVEFLFRDGNSNNINTKNVVMTFKDGPIESLDNPGYFYVPFYTSYVINKAGEVLNWRRNLKMSPYYPAIGYLVYSAITDDGKRITVGQHRLLALAFLKYGPNVRKLDVNHKDGIKSNNELKNLEWATRKRNCDHAYQTGLRNDNVVVQVMSAYTKEVFEFYSITECARVLGAGHTLVLQRLQSDGQKVFKNGFLFKRKDSSTPWLDVDVSQLSHLGIGRLSKFRLKKDDFVLTTDSYMQVSVLTGVGMASVRWRLDNWKHPVKLNDYECDLVDMSAENESASVVIRKVSVHQLLEVPKSLSTTT